MAESDIYNLLALSQRGTDHFLKNDPFYGSAINIAKMQIPEAETNTQAFLGPMLQGLLSGGLANYGKQNAYDKGYEEARANPLLRSLQGYESAERPQGWEPDKGQNDALMQALLGQQAQEKMLEELKQKADMQRALLPYSQFAVDAEGAKKKAVLEAEMGATGLGIKPEDQLKIELDYTNKLTTGNEAQKLVETQTRARNVLEALKVSDPIRAATAIYGFAKILDPEGVVRKEDGTIVANPGGPAGQLASWHNTLMQKGQLTEQTKKAMREIIPDLVRSQEGAYKSLSTTLLDVATKQGARKDRIGTLPEMDLSSLIEQPGAIPPGMKLQRNKVTGETRLVPL
jgi:hypothetical protein